jgi:iron complex outermembrane receptor protein
MTATIIKKPAPDVILGINTQVIYKQFSAGLAAHGYFGNYMYNNFNAGATLRSIKNPINFIGNTGVNYLETDLQIPRCFLIIILKMLRSLRLDNINLGYNVGKIFMTRPV